MSNSLSFSPLQSMAFAWASSGARVFPVNEQPKLDENGEPAGTTKRPCIKAYQSQAVGRDDMVMIPELFSRGNRVGIATEASKLIVIDFDIDPKTWAFVDLLPRTYTQRTPRGGEHRYFWAPGDIQVGSSANRLGKGIDVRAYGGFVVTREFPPPGWESLVEMAPEWLVEMCGPPAALERDPSKDVPLADLPTPEDVKARAIEYLKESAPEIRPPGVNPQTYQVICRLRDLGVMEADALPILWDNYESIARCGWTKTSLAETVGKAYRYAKGGFGADNPAPKFDPSDTAKKFEEIDAKRREHESNLPEDHPFLEMNKEFCWILCGSRGQILWELDEKNIRLLDTRSFYDLNAPKTMPAGNKVVQVAQSWMSWPGRRTYTDLVFKPQSPCLAGEYNLWKGFSIEPAVPGETSREGYEGFQMWLELVRESLCAGSEAGAEWLLGYMAHMFQRPGKKPLTGVVLRSVGKGTGKNSAVEPLARILGDHATISSRSRYLTGRFNAHLERCLMLILDEAFWSRGQGVNEAQAILQDLITGKFHQIEHKHVDSYAVPNLTRVFMLSNKDWVIPASVDERRYAVFDVAEDKKQDLEWFHRMWTLLEEKGGLRWLLRYLLDRPVSNVNAAPKTHALKEQIIENMNAVESWWVESLDNGKLLDAEVDIWPREMEKERVRDAIYRHYAHRGWRGLRPTIHQITKRLRRMCPEVEVGKMPVGDRVPAFQFPSLERCRMLFEDYTGGWEWSNRPKQGAG